MILLFKWDVTKQILSIESLDKFLCILIPSHGYLQSIEDYTAFLNTPNPQSHWSLWHVISNLIKSAELLSDLALPHSASR